MLHYLDELENNLSDLLNLRDVDDKAFLAKLAIDNPTIKSKQAMTLFVFKKALEAAPLRELKIMIGKNNPQSWYRLIADIKKVKLPSNKSSFKVIRDNLTNFKMIKEV